MTGAVARMSSSTRQSVYGAPAIVAASEQVTRRVDHAVVDAQQSGDAPPAEDEQGQPPGQAQEEQEVSGRARFGREIEHSSVHGPTQFGRA